MIKPVNLIELSASQQTESQEPKTEIELIKIIPLINKEKEVLLEISQNRKFYNQRIHELENKIININSQRLDHRGNLKKRFEEFNKILFEVYDKIKNNKNKKNIKSEKKEINYLYELNNNLKNAFFIDLQTSNSIELKKIDNLLQISEKETQNIVTSLSRNYDERMLEVFNEFLKEIDSYNSLTNDLVKMNEEREISKINLDKLLLVEEDYMREKSVLFRNNINFKYQDVTFI